MYYLTTPTSLCSDNTQNLHWSTVERIPRQCPPRSKGRCDGKHRTLWSPEIFYARLGRHCDATAVQVWKCRLLFCLHQYCSVYKTVIIAIVYSMATRNPDKINNWYGIFSNVANSSKPLWLWRTSTLSRETIIKYYNLFSPYFLRDTLLIHLYITDNAFQLEQKKNLQEITFLLYGEYITAWKTIPLNFHFQIH